MEKQIIKTKNVLLTGKPGIGKTTAIMRIIELLRSKGVPVSGFYTEEQRDKSGVRTGFMIKTLSGAEGVMASVKSGVGPKVGKYTVDVKAIDTIAVPSVIEEGGVTVIDEIGKMEIFSNKFKQAVKEALDKGRLVGTVMQKPNPFADQIKGREDVKVVTLTLGNRDKIPADIIKLLGI